MLVGWGGGGVGVKCMQIGRCSLGADTARIQVPAGINTVACPR
jgi:hypothetical protein